MSRPLSRTRRILLLLAALAIAAAGWITAIFVLDVTDKRTETIISLSLKIVPTIVAMAVTLWSIVGSKNKAPPDNASPSALPDRQLRVQPVESISEDESLRQAIRISHALLADLQAEAVTFVPLHMRTDRPEPDKIPVARLTWVRREIVQELTVNKSEPIELTDLTSLSRRISLLGDPGSGKSTVLRELCRRQLNHLEVITGTGAPLPVLISLSRWIDTTESAAEFLRRQLEHQFGPGNFYVRNFENEIVVGRFLFLLDGLNEMRGRRLNLSTGEQDVHIQGTPGFQQGTRTENLDRRELSLRQFAEDSRACSFVLTCRAHEYFESSAWQSVRVEDVDESQADAFVDAYADPEKSTPLKRELRQNPLLAAIASNPFFLRSVIAAYQPGQLLTSRGQILEALIARLGEREFEKQTTSITDGHVNQAAIAAFQMLQGGRVGDKSPLSAAAEPEWQQILTNTGLLVHRGSEFFFRHQIIQEYFAAIAMRRRLVRASLKRLLADERWSETISLWRDMDPRLEKRLLASLHARNLPRRIPQSTSSPPYAVFALATTTPVVLVLGWYAIELWLGHVNIASWPFSLIPVEPIVLVISVMLLRLLWRPLMPHRRVITNAAYVLGRSGNAAAVPPLLGAMRRLYYQDRDRVALAIAQFGTSANPQVHAGLRARRWRVRCGSAQTLSAMIISEPDGAAATTAVAACEVPDVRLVRPLLEALARSAVPEKFDAMKVLADRLGSGSAWLATMRVQSMSSTLSKSNPSISTDEITTRAADLLAQSQSLAAKLISLRIVGSLRPPGASELLQRVAYDSSESDAIRQGAVSALGMLEPSASIPELLRFLENEDLEAPARQALRKMRDQAAVEFLREGSTGSNNKVRLETVNCLCAIGGTAIGPILMDMNSDDDDAVRRAVAIGLSSIDGERAAPTLERLARDADGEVRKAAIRSLGINRGSLSQEILLRLAQDQKFVDRRHAIRELSAFDSSVVHEGLRGMAGDVDREIRKTVSRSIRDIERRGEISRARPWRHPFATLKAAVLNWLNWSVIREMIREERRAGVPKANMVSRLQVRGATNAEDARALQNAFRLSNWFFNVGFVLGLMLLILLCRLSLNVAGLLLDHWPVCLAVLLVFATSMLPQVGEVAWKYDAVLYSRITFWILVGVSLGLLLLAAVTYAWSILLSLVLVVLVTCVSIYVANCIRVSNLVRRAVSEG